MARSPVARRGALVAVVLAAWLDAPAAATRDEVRDLRLSVPAEGQVLLDWSPPMLAASDYRVRRCPLRAAGATSGLCIAEGILETEHVDDPPAGSYFYLITATVDGSERTSGSGEGPLGPVPRPQRACGAGPDPTPMVVRVVLLEAIELCGSQVEITFPAGSLLYDGFGCIGIQDGFLGSGNDPEAGLVVGGCGNPDPTFGPGDLCRFELLRQECPPPPAALRLEACQVSDCRTGRLDDVACALVFD